MTAPVWLNGRLLPASSARLDVSDRGFTLGDGVFETIAVRDGQPRWFERHYRRLRDGAAVLGIPLAWSEADARAAIGVVTAAGELPDAAVRITLSRGPASRGVPPPADPRPTLLVTAGPLPPPAPPARLIIARSTCRNERSPLARIKSLNYLDSILARREAMQRGADDAIMLDTRGRVAESSAATIVMLLDGAVVTPPVGDGALPGIARGVLLDAGTVVERSVTETDLQRVAAALLVNVLGAREVLCIEQTMLRSAAESPLFRCVSDTLRGHALS